MRGGVGFLIGPWASAAFGGGLRGSLIAGALEGSLTDGAMQITINWASGRSWHHNLGWTLLGGGLAGGVGGGIGWKWGPKHTGKSTQPPKAPVVADLPKTPIRLPTPEQAQTLIDDIVTNELRNIRLSFPLRYNSNLPVTLGHEEYGRSNPLKDIEIGAYAILKGRNDALQTIIQEELYRRLFLKDFFYNSDEMELAMDQAVDDIFRYIQQNPESDVETYVDNTVQRLFDNFSDIDLFDID